MGPRWTFKGGSMTAGSATSSLRKAVERRAGVSNTPLSTADFVDHRKVDAGSWAGVQVGEHIGKIGHRNAQHLARLAGTEFAQIPTVSIYLVVLHFIRSTCMSHEPSLQPTGR